jgi:hypothetical protein
MGKEGGRRAARRAGGGVNIFCTITNNNIRIVTGDFVARRKWRREAKVTSVYVRLASTSGAIYRKQIVQFLPMTLASDRRTTIIYGPLRDAYSQ